MCLASCTIYSGILGDVFTPLLNVAGVPARFNTRSTNIIVLAAAVLAPLSLLEDLTKLAFTSMLGCLAVLYTVLFIARRAFDGSYVSGPLLDALPAALAPSFATSSIDPSLALGPKVARRRARRQVDRSSSGSHG